MYVRFTPKADKIVDAPVSLLCAISRHNAILRPCPLTIESGHEPGEPRIVIWAWLHRKWGFGKGKSADAGGHKRVIRRPDFETMFVFWTGLLAKRGLPQAVRWVFHEDFVRVPSIRNWRFAFRLRPIMEADRIARFAYAHLDAENPLAIVAYAVHDGSVVTGFQGDVFSANEDVYRDDWNIYFDARETKDMISPDCEIVSDEVTWARLRAEQPRYLSELDYLVSVDALRCQFGYRD